MFSIWRSPLLRETIAFSRKEQHLHSIALLHASLIRNRDLWHKEELVSKYKKICTSQGVACSKGFKRFFEDETLQYFRNLLRILESPRGPH